MKLNTILTLLQIKEYSKKLSLFTGVSGGVYRQNLYKWAAFSFTEFEEIWIVNYKEIKVPGDNLSDFYGAHNFTEWLNNKQDIPSLDYQIQRVIKLKAFT